MTEPRIVYTPGDWVAVSRRDGWALVQWPLTDPRVPAVWNGLADSIDQVLDDLLHSGVRSLRGFALLKQEDDGLRCALREPARLVVESLDSTQEYDGTTRPYLDIVISPTPTRVTVHGSETSGTIELPMRDGIVSAGLLCVDLDPSLRGGMARSARALRTPIDPPGDLPAPTTVSAGVMPAEPPASPSVGAGPSAAEPATPVPVVLEPAVPQATVAATESAERHETLRPSPPDQQSKYHRLLQLETADRQAFLSQLRAEEEAAALQAEAEDETGGQPVPSGSAAPPSPGSAKESNIWVDPPDIQPVIATPQKVAPVPRKAAPEITDGIPWLKDPLASSAPAMPPKTSPQRTSVASASLVETPPSPSLSPQELSAVTMSRSALPQLIADEVPVGATVLAYSCAAGHLSPTTAPTCRVCGDRLPDQKPIRVARPVLGQLTFSNGLTVTLDRSVVFGREPQPVTDNPSDRPNLIRPIESGELSRMHASVTLDGWDVVLRDLGSTHGTFLTLPGGAMRKIRANEDYPLEPGSVVSLAEIVSFTYETKT